MNTSNYEEVIDKLSWRRFKMSVIFLSLLHRQKNWLALGLSRLLVVPKNLHSMDCKVNKVWTNLFEEAFNEYYMTIHPCLGLFTFLTWFVTFRTWIAEKMLVQISFTLHCSLTSQHDQNQVVTSRKSITKYWKVKKVATIKNIFYQGSLTFRRLAYIIHKASKLKAPLAGCPLLFLHSVTSTSNSLAMSRALTITTAILTILHSYVSAQTATCVDGTKWVCWQLKLSYNNSFFNLVAI